MIEKSLVVVETMMCSVVKAEGTIKGKMVVEGMLAVKGGSMVEMMCSAVKKEGTIEGKKGGMIDERMVDGMQTLTLTLAVIKKSTACLLELLQGNSNEEVKVEGEILL